VGLCSGVQRAVRGALSAAEEHAGGRLYAYGELVHNPAIMRQVQAAGITVIDNLSAVRHGDRVIVRAHGISPAEEAAISAVGGRILDLTCPRVKAIHRTILDRTARGFRVYIVGHPAHPETRGHLGYAGAGGCCIQDPATAAEHHVPGPGIVVAQTTTNAALFSDVAAELRTRDPGLEVLDTICSSVSERQDWIQRVSREVGASLVLGGRNSSNTARLFDIARANGPAHLIESAEELDLTALAMHRAIALTSGASTPIESVRSVEHALEQAGMLVDRNHPLSRTMVFPNPPSPGLAK